jgi:hypothetical protein
MTTYAISVSDAQNLFSDLSAALNEANYTVKGGSGTLIFGGQVRVLSQDGAVVARIVKHGDRLEITTDDPRFQEAVDRFRQTHPQIQLLSPRSESQTTPQSILRELRPSRIEASGTEPIIRTLTPLEYTEFERLVASAGFHMRGVPGDANNILYGSRHAGSVRIERNDFTMRPEQYHITTRDPMLLAHLEQAGRRGSRDPTMDGDRTAVG